MIKSIFAAIATVAVLGITAVGNAGVTRDELIVGRARTDAFCDCYEANARGALTVGGRSFLVGMYNQFCANPTLRRNLNIEFAATPNSEWVPYCRTLNYKMSEMDGGTVVLCTSVNLLH
jgi:hypothetical protein